MTRAHCDETTNLMDREPHGLSESERLVLERHVAECAACRDALRMTRVVRETLRDASPRLSETARLRALERALDAGPAARPMPHIVPRARWLTGALGVAAVAAASLLVHMQFDGDVVPKPSVAMPTPPKLAVAAPTAPSAGSAADEGVETSHVLGAARVHVTAATRARFDASARTVSLEQGQVDVDARAETTPVNVRTQHFRVEAAAAQFVVTPDAVEVVHGKVRVFDLAGRVLKDEVPAGASYTFAAPVPTRESAPAVSGKAWLERARKSVAVGKVDDARKHLARAEQAKLERTDRGEAATLRAELALLERNPRAALDLYENVARNFAELRAGENAAYAAAQLARRSAPDQEARLLRGYLARYPQGRFSREAKLRLDQL